MQIQFVELEIGVMWPKESAVFFISFSSILRKMFQFASRWHGVQVMFIANSAHLLLPGWVCDKSVGEVMKNPLQL